MYHFEVALSFAGEQRCYVRNVAATLSNWRIRVFYDEFEKVRLWGKHAAEELQQVYEHRSDWAVIFISKEYVDKAWPTHERRAILSRAVQQRSEFVLPVRFGDTEVPGFPGDLIHVYAEDYSAVSLAGLIAKKIGIDILKIKASQVPPPGITNLAGDVAFAYSKYNGRYVIGRGTLEFETKWTKASDTSIHVYNDPASINGVALAPLGLTEISQLMNAESLNYTSRARTPRLGQIVVFRNIHGFYAAVQVLEIKDDTRGDDCDELSFRFAIQPNGSDSFSDFS